MMENVNEDLPSDMKTECSMARNTENITQNMTNHHVQIEIDHERNSTRKTYDMP